MTLNRLQKQIKSHQETTLIMIAKMHHNKGFCVSSLRRKISPYFKTWQNGHRFGIINKETGAGVKCIFVPSPDGNNYVHILYSHNKPHLEFSFTVKSNKHFLEKLINHSLLY